MLQIFPSAKRAWRVLQRDISSLVDFDATDTGGKAINEITSHLVEGMSYEQVLKKQTAKSSDVSSLLPGTALALALVPPLCFL